MKLAFYFHLHPLFFVTVLAGCMCCFWMELYGDGVDVAMLNLGATLAASFPVIVVLLLRGLGLLEAGFTMASDALQRLPAACTLLRLGLTAWGHFWGNAALACFPVLSGGLRLAYWNLPWQVSYICGATVVKRGGT